MHECTSIIINSFPLFLIFSLHVYMLLSFFFSKGVIQKLSSLWMGEGVLKNQNKKAGGWGVKPLCEKNCLLINFSC